MKYQYMVDAQNPGHVKLYDGTDVADAMAAFSKAISDGVEYVTLEALRELPKPREGLDFPCGTCGLTGLASPLCHSNPLTEGS